MQNESTNQPHLLNQATVDFDKFYISETRKLQKRLWERFKKFLPNQSGISRPHIVRLPIRWYHDTRFAVTVSTVAASSKNKNKISQ
jgi:hypothetical protein